MSLDQGTSTSQAAEESVLKKVDVPLSERNMRQLNRSFKKQLVNFQNCYQIKKIFKKLKKSL